ncbi:hypothetical protein GN109_07760 [Collimonas pratensis]|uniref:glycosyltransferase family 9 protein n=1 Tax=Collimonas pratensis TaxID=279113 RepID=UPI00143DAA3C|nr:glycosyltransferase family 9 protein [Collimonas pratensis]NKI69309.1 hypothetical protein [Collimonas pratensis]
MNNLTDLVAAYRTYQSQASLENALNLMRKLRGCRKVEDAIELALKWSDKADTLLQRTQLGIDMNYLGMFSQASPLLEEAMPQWPVYPHDYYLIASEVMLTRYCLGNYQDAHPLFRKLRSAEWCEIWSRLSSPNGDNAWFLPYKDRVLEGQPVAGKRIMIALEGGAGDLLQFLRHAESLQRDGAAAIYCQAPHYLHGLFNNSSLPITLVDNLQIDFDYITWPFSLHAIYQESPYFPSAQEDYLTLSDEYRLPEILQQKLAGGRGDGRRRIGLTWRSESGARHEPFRSTELSTLVPLLEHETAEFFSLQVGTLSEEERSLLERHGVTDLGGHLQSFEETAYVLKQLDLLITVDSAPAHLAGTCNIPVWVMLAQACDHRWYVGQRYTPWYASMRLYRQAALGDWRPVIEDMLASLITQQD